MRAFLIAGLLLLVTTSPSAAADGDLRVSASILPLQGLVRAVMHDPARPDFVPNLILPPGASPHAYALKPSEARALASADVVFRVGPSLEAFLDRPLNNLASGAVRIDLVETPGLVLLPVRDDEDYESHDHGSHGHADDDHADHDDHADRADDDHDAHEHKHDDHADEDHDAHERKHDDHAKDDHTAHAHDDDDDDEHEHEHEHADEHDEEHVEHVDPHIWLHPANAMAMARQIADVLSKADPERAALYQANAKQTIASLKKAATGFEANWQELRSMPEPAPFVVFHDSLQYFEHWSGLASSGSITLNPEVPPGARHMPDLRERMVARGVKCVFVEPQLDGRIARQIARDAGLAVHVVDPLGTTVAPTSADNSTGGFAPLVAGIRQALTRCHAQ